MDVSSIANRPVNFRPLGQGLWKDGVVVFPKQERCWVIRVEGYDTSVPADEMKKALKDHFRSCGIIVTVEIHDNYALITMTGNDAAAKSSKLDGSELGGFEIVVDTKPYPFPDFEKLYSSALSFGGNPGTNNFWVGVNLFHSPPLI